MNPFEKIFNYQLLSRLGNSGAIVLTSYERSWLKTMLQHPSASAAFAPETLQKLMDLLNPDEIIEMNELLLHRAASREKQVYHSLLSPLRKAIMNKCVIQLTYAIKNGKTFTEREVFPYKLEYSMVKREWYLLWYHERRRSLMSTKLDKIIAIHERHCPEERYEQFMNDINAYIKKQTRTIDIRVMKPYNMELSRILYAFSCFEKEVHYDADLDEYTIQLSFSSNEGEYVLSKIRFLGKRVYIDSGDYMRQRMLETTGKALARYGE